MNEESTNVSAGLLPRSLRIAIVGKSRNASRCKIENAPLKYEATRNINEEINRERKFCFCIYFFS